MEYLFFFFSPSNKDLKEIWKNIKKNIKEIKKYQKKKIWKKMSKKSIKKMSKEKTMKKREEIKIKIKKINKWKGKRGEGGGNQHCSIQCLMFEFSYLKMFFRLYSLAFFICKGKSKENKVLITIYYETNIEEVKIYS